MFLVNGQGCITLKRLYVHEDIYSALGTALIAYARHIKTGDGFGPDSALGPSQNRPQYERLRSTLKAIENSGTKILYQGQIPQDSKGFFIPVNRITAKALIIVGRHDYICPLALSEHLHEGIPQSQLAVFEESGHFPWLEGPDRFFAILNGFLSS